MEEKKELFIKEMRPGVYLMDEAHISTGYLVVGETKACMIDTMNGYNDLAAEVAKLTDKPVFVINTHGHPDHIFGNPYFEEVYMHPDDLPVANMFAQDPEFLRILKEKNGTMPAFREVHEGDVFDLGGRTLEIYELPGHTPGGILVLLKEERILFTGDGINHHLWMQLDHSLPVTKLIESLDRVMFLEEKADVILHGHAHDFDDISLMRCLREGAAEIVNGKTDADVEYTYFGGQAMLHPFACPEDKHYQQADHSIIYQPGNIREA